MNGWERMALDGGRSLVFTEHGNVLSVPRGSLLIRRLGEYSVTSLLCSQCVEYIQLVQSSEVAHDRVIL